MDNKTKFLCVAIAVLLVSNGYLLYRLSNAEDKTQPVAGSQESSLAGYYHLDERPAKRIYPMLFI